MTDERDDYADVNYFPPTRQRRLLLWWFWSNVVVWSLFGVLGFVALCGGMLF